MSVLLYLICALLGLIVGNAATSIYYRLPRNIEICALFKEDNKPFCSYCKHPLKPHECLPVLGWISTLGRCNYCDISIPIDYFILELSGMILSCWSFYCFQESYDLFVLIFLFNMGCILFILYLIRYNYIPNLGILCILVLGMIYRTLIDRTIFEWVCTLSITLFVLYSLRIKNNHCLFTLSILAFLWCKIGEALCYETLLIVLYFALKKIQKLEVLYVSGILCLLANVSLSVLSS